MLATRDELARLYASPQSEADQRLGKDRLLAGLKDRYQVLKQRWNGYQGYDSWFAHDLNNAKLGSLHTYTRFVPAFEVLFDRSGRDFAAFYQAAATLGRLPAAGREACLQVLLQGNDCAGLDGLAAGLTVTPCYETHGLLVGFAALYPPY